MAASLSQGAAPAVVAIPAWNEAERIADCLSALGNQTRPLAGGVLLANNCIDGTEAIARRVTLPFRLDIRSVALPPEQAHAGMARRLAMQHAADLAGPDGVVLTTDADAIVPPDWVELNLDAVCAGADAVCGKAMIDPREAELIPPHLHADDALECQYADLLDAIAEALCPDPADPRPRHIEASGASLAVTAAAFDRVGGVPLVATGEDRALVAALAGIDAQIRHDPAIRVTVSGRIVGRAPGGMADTIRRRIVQQDEFSDAQLEPAVDAYRRADFRRRVWAAWDDRDAEPDLAADLLLRRDVLGRSARRALSRRRLGRDRAPQSCHAPPAGALRRPAAPDRLRSRIACFATDSHGPPMMQRLALAVPGIQQRASGRDERAEFPTEEVALLREAGVLAAPLPIEDPIACPPNQLATLLATVGRASLPLGRILEAHVNARHLITRFGTPEQCRAMASDAVAGHLFALWVTDPPDGGLRMTREGNAIRLHGGKMFCSAAGHATRAVVTAWTPEHTAQMLVVPLGLGERVSPLPAPLAGMRAASTGAVDFTECLVDRAAVLGQPGDYLQEPTFSAGAWRGSAVALGGLCAIIEVLQGQLRDAGRLDDPHQSARMGEALIARETARSWVGRVARIAERPDADPASVVAAVGLGRLAVEAACHDAMVLAQRSLGLTAFRRGHPMERLCRDLATYLRQPAPDMVLTEAAAWFSRQPAPAIVSVC